MATTNLGRRDFLRNAAAGAATAALAADVVLQAAVQSTNTTRPNILLIVAEDMGVQLGCYGDATVPTPRLDHLAQEGVCFLNGYVTQASCSPSRSSILTGLYPHETNQLGLAHVGYTMHRGIPGLSKLLKACGYRTGIQGKLHVGPGKDHPFDVRGNDHSKDVRAYATSARTFLEQTDKAPWFLYVNYADCHKPFAHQHKGLPEKPVSGSAMKPFPAHGEIDDPVLMDETAGYYNGVQRVDAGVGMLLDLLDEKHLTETTLVLFIGDHGPPMSRGKTTTYEFGVHVPVIMRWPGNAMPGLRSKALVSTVDILPTLVSAAGGTLPHPLAGTPLQGPLRGDTTHWRETLMTEWHAHGPGFQPQRAIRDARYKLILNLRTDVTKQGLGVDGCAMAKALRKPAYQDTEAKRVFDMLRSPPAVELYDLQADPAEYTNLAGDPRMKDVERRLKEALRTWRQKTRDPFLDAATFATYKTHYDEYVRTLPEEREKVKPDRQGRRQVPIDMRRFQKDWATVVQDRYADTKP